MPRKTQARGAKAYPEGRVAQQDDGEVDGLHYEGDSIDVTPGTGQGVSEIVEELTDGPVDLQGSVGDGIEEVTSVPAGRFFEVPWFLRSLISARASGEASAISSPLHQARSGSVPHTPRI